MNSIFTSSCYLIANMVIIFLAVILFNIANYIWQKKEGKAPGSLIMFLLITFSPMNSFKNTVGFIKDGPGLLIVILVLLMIVILSYSLDGTGICG